MGERRHPERGRPWGSRRRRGRVLAAILLAAALIASAGIDGAGTTGEDAAPDSRPNLVLIMTDDQTAESMRVMQRVRSQIGGQGATFEQSYVNFPLCCPSRATLMTGQYAHNHRVLDNVQPAGGFKRFESLHGRSNLATWLDDAGYRTALVGKYFNGYGDDGRGFVPPGWDAWYGAVEPAQYVYDYALNENGRVVHYGNRASDFKQDVLTAKAIDVIERSAGTGPPLFLDLAYTAPHAAGPHHNPQPPRNCPASPKPPPRFAHAFDDEPLPRPPAFNEANVSDKPIGIRRRPLIGPEVRKRLRARYRCTLESLQAVDEGAGEIIDALRRTGELDNTLVVFTSDNGLFFGEHRIRLGKVRHYEEATRVPLLMRGPGIEPGSIVPDPVINADLAPTLLDAAGAEAPTALDGISLLPLGADPGLDPDRDLLLESQHYAGVRSGRYVYVEHGRAAHPGARELYDLEADPYELHNLSRRSRYAGTRRNLAARLSALRDCAGASCR